MLGDNSGLYFGKAREREHRLNPECCFSEFFSPFFSEENDDAIDCSEDLGHPLLLVDDNGYIYGRKGSVQLRLRFACLHACMLAWHAGAGTTKEGTHFAAGCLA